MDRSLRPSRLSCLTDGPDSELQSSLRQLSLNDEGSIKDISRPAQDPKPKRSDVRRTKKKVEEVADSWEDEADSDAESGPPTPTAPTSSSTQKTTKLDTGLDNDNENDQEGPRDPPPTPISPQTSQPQQQSWPAPGAPVPAYGNPSGASPRSAGPARRPEKQTAVAGRMIAGALGIRAPKRTEEQRAYDRSVKEQELGGGIARGRRLLRRGRRRRGRRLQFGMTDFFFCLLYSVILYGALCK